MKLVAMMLCPLTMVPFMLMSGFFLNMDSVPSWMTWLSAVSPHRYLFEAIMTNEFAGTCTQPHHRPLISVYVFV